MPKPGGCHSFGISLGDVLRLPKRHPAWRRREAQSGSCMERENLPGDAKGKSTSGSNREAESTDAPERRVGNQWDRCRCLLCQSDRLNGQRRQHWLEEHVSPTSPHAPVPSCPSTTIVSSLSCSPSRAAWVLSSPCPLRCSRLLPSMLRAANINWAHGSCSSSSSRSRCGSSSEP